MLPNDHNKQSYDEFGTRHEDNLLIANDCVSSNFSSAKDIDSDFADMFITGDDFEGEVSYYPSCLSDKDDNKEKSLSDKFIK